MEQEVTLNKILDYYDKTIDLLGEKSIYHNFQQELQREIYEIISSRADDTAMVIRGCGKHTRFLIETFDLRGINVVGILDKGKVTDRYGGYPVYTLEQQQDIQYGVVLISSFIFRKQIREEYEGTDIEIIDIYEELEKRNIYLNGPFYEYLSTTLESTQTVVNYFYREYKRSEREGKNTVEQLRAMVRLLLEVKDFVLIHSFYEENLEIFDSDTILKEVWRRTKELLKMMKCAITARKQKDIFWFWIDAVSNDSINMPKLEALFDKGLFFEKAYTSTPFTDSTQQMLFRQIYPISQYSQRWTKIAENNSSVIQYLHSNGYLFRCIGGDTAFAPSVLIETKSYLSCNMIFWEAMCQLLQEEKPQMLLLQFAVETHPPIVAPNLEKRSIDIYAYPDKIQIHKARQYKDDCLELYRELLGNKIQIYMSDHGDHLAENDPIWSEHKLHTFFFIYGSGIPKGRIRELFPYIRFEKIVQWLIEPNSHELLDACDTNIAFQDTDVYDSALVQRRINQGKIRRALAYRGAMNANYKYVINSIGEEFFYQIVDGEEIPLEELPEGDKEELKKVSGNHFLDVYKEERFIAVRKIYQMLANGRGL